MIMFLHGEDSFRSLRRLRLLKDAFQKKYDPRGHNIFVFEGEDFNFEAFRQAVTVGGLFTQKRLVIVKRFLEARHKFSESSLIDILTHNAPSVDCIIIFWESEKFSDVRSRPSQKYASDRSTIKSVPAIQSSLHTLLGFLLSCEHVEYYGKISPLQASRWLRDECRKYNISIESGALNLLVQLVGVNLWRLHAEIQKLLHYVCGSGGNRITRTEVEQFVRANGEETIFAFLDALSVRQVVRTVHLVHTLFAQGLTEAYILSMLTRQVRILLKIQSAREFSSQPGVLATQLGLHPFVVKKGLAQIQHFTFEELKYMYLQLVEIDRIRKTTSVSSRTLLEMFIVRFASNRASVTSSANIRSSELRAYA